MGTATSETEAPTRFIPTPEPGIYYDNPAEVYHRWDAMSNSWGGKILNGSLKHFKWEREQPEQPPSKAQLLGTALHALCLEPLRFAARFALEPKVNKRTNAGKEDLATFSDLNQGKTIISPETHAQAVPMAEALLDHAVAGEMIRDGKPEVSLVWDAPEFGVRCKARLDYLWSPIIADLKTTRNGDPDAFAKACQQYGYDRQSAFYLDGAQILGLPVEEFAFATVESSPPYDVVVYTADPLMLEAGRRKYKRALWHYAKALETNVWPGRNEVTAELIGLPRWALAEEGLDGRI